MKFLTTVCLIVSLATVAWTRSAIWGSRYGNDRLLYQENAIRGAQNRKYQSLNVAFPRPGQSNYINITAIYVLDHFRNSSGAQPSLWSGGPGYKFANVNLKSQYSKGINSTAQFYGR